jgi:hypothetical protein
MRGHLLVVAAFGTALMSALACGTDPVGVETCRKIERARCENAPAIEQDEDPAEATAESLVDSVTDLFAASRDDGDGDG